MCMFCRSLFVLLAIVLSVLIRFTDSDYPFGIFRLFLTRFTILLKKKKEEEICWSEKTFISV
jgi:hypothetical protein